MITPNLRNTTPRAQRIHRLMLVCGLSLLAGMSTTMSVTAQPASYPMTMFAPASDVNNTDRSELLALNALSYSLIERARGGRADATRFRIDATLYRESLRRLMLRKHDSESTYTDTDSLYTQMVRMAALLNAAADCKTGRYITCPAELMRQLDNQQKLINQSFDKPLGGSS